MSTTIDQQVVEMRFDNRQFENNVSTTMSSLGKLKQSLNLSGASRGLENVGAAARGINLSSLCGAAETVGLKFNAMYTMADQALRNITNSAMNAGKRIVSALTIDPIKTGLSEYETQINAVQTILANTESKGTTLDDVNGALDTLNEYADKTIYNFTEMTRNIGTFTAAGVDLDTSVNAIQGIANLAAVSGSNSQQASTAMYQLSQALSSGTVKLMDWNSVVNAGMGGQVFQDALKETARVHGIAIDSMIERNGSFRETLQEGWLTADILTETLSHFTMAAEEGSEQWNEYKKSLMDSGYSEEQANAILRLSNTATDAATKVKTATQLWDTLKETAQSGWTQTWEIILGDFEEAKSLFSELYSTFAPIIEATSKTRNELLQGWADAGGRDDLLQSMRNIFEGIGNIIKPIKGAFEEIFPPSSLEERIKGLKGLTEGLRKFTENFVFLESGLEPVKDAKGAFEAVIGGTDEIAAHNERLRSTLDKISRTFKGLFAFVDIVAKAVKALATGLFDIFGLVSPVGGGILSLTASIGDWLVALNESIEANNVFEKALDRIREAFVKAGEFLSPIIDSVKEFGSAFSEAFSEIYANATERLSPLTIIGSAIKAIFSSLGKIIRNVAPFLTEAASAIGNLFGSLGGRLMSAIKEADYSEIFDIFNSGVFGAIGVFIAKFIKSGGDLVDNAGGFLENINGILEGAGDALSSFTEAQKADVLQKIAIAIGILAASLLVLSLIDSERLTVSLVAITTLFGELMGSLTILNKIMSKSDFKGIGKVVGAIIGLGAAMLILSVALKIMSTMSWSEMGVGLITLTVGLGALVGAVNLLPDAKVNTAAKAIQKMSFALLVLAVAIKIMSTMSWSEMGVGLISMVVGLGALVGAVHLLPKDTALRAAGMVGLATAMVILAAALKIMATMSWGEVAVSLAVLGGSLLILAGAMNLMVSALPGAAAMLVVAPALVVLATALKIMATMSWGEVARGLTLLAGSLAIIAVAMTLMIGALPGAAALLVVAASLAILTPVLMALGSMSLAEIGKSLLMLAGTFAVIGLAAAVLAPVVPVILTLSASLLLLGTACVAIGAGVLMLGVGLTAISAAGSGVALALVTIVSSIIGLIPYLIQQVGVGIIALCEVIAGSASAICEALTVIIVSAVDAMVTAVPSLVEGVLVLVTTLLESLITYVPQLVPLLVSLVSELLGALSGQVSILVESIFGFLGALLDAIAANLSTLIAPVANLLGKIFQGIADILGPVVQSVIAPLLGVLADMVVGIVEAIAPYLPQLTIMFATLAEVVSDAIVAIIEAIAPFMPSIQAMISSICNAFVALASQIAPIIDSISNLVKTLGDVIIGVLDGISETITSIGEVIESALSGLAEIFDSVFGGISEVVTSVGDSIKKVLDGIAGVIESIGKAALDAGTGFDNLANGVKTITNLKLADMVASLAAVASGVGDVAKHSDGLKEVGSGMKELVSSVTDVASGFASVSSSITATITSLSSIKTVLSNTVASFSEVSSSMATVGKDIMTSITSGIESQETNMSSAAKSAMLQFVNALKNGTSNAKRACQTLVKSCATAIKSGYSSFKSAGGYLVKGFANGISVNTYLATAKARAMANAAANAARKALSIRSPSRVGYEIGDFFGIGFINGMADNVKRAYNTSKDVADSAKNGLSDAIGRVGDFINSDIDTQPTIRPVLDLSDVESGASMLSSMFAAGPSVGVLANVGAINSMMNRRSQNGVNSDVVTAIDKLRKDISSLERNVYTVGNVTYDDGSNVANAVQALAHAALMGRRT